MPLKLRGTTSTNLDAGDSTTTIVFGLRRPPLLHPEAAVFTHFLPATTIRQPKTGERVKVFDTASGPYTQRLPGRYARTYEISGTLDMTTSDSAAYAALETLTDATTLRFVEEDRAGLLLRTKLLSRVRIESLQPEDALDIAGRISTRRYRLKLTEDTSA